jgi:hypothetical protein
MKSKLIAIALLGLLSVLPAWAGKGEPKFKSMEVRHFSRAEGVEISPDFPDFLYAALREDLQKTGLFKEMVGENEVVDPKDAAQSFILEGSILEVGKGSVAKAMTIGMGVGRRSLRVHVEVRRRSDNESILDREIKVRAPATGNPKMLAKSAAKEITGQVKKGLKP